jgi:hypothetical protein
MPPKSREEILRFYEKLCHEAGHRYAEGMCRFLPTLFRERPLDGCTFFTSHAALCIVRYPTYPEWIDKPVIDIISTAPDRLRMQLVVTLNPLPIYRTSTESVNCPLDLALEEFDALYAKFLTAHEPGNQTWDAE